VSAGPLAQAIDPELGDAFRWVAIALPLWCIRMVAVCTSQGLLMLSHRALVCNVLWPAGNVAGVWLLCMVLDWGLEGALLSLDLSMLLGVIVALVLLARARPDVMSRSEESTWDLAGIAKFSAPLWVYSVVHWIFAWSDQVLVAALGGMSAAGAYGPVANLAPLFALGLTALNGVFAPVISELHSARQMEELARLYRTVTRWALVLTLPGVLLALGAPDRIIALWPAGQEEAWNALRLIAAAQLVATAVGSVNFLLIMSGHQHHVLYSGLPAIALNVGLCYLLIPEHGVMGAATANAVATATANLLALGQVWYLLRMHPFHLGLLKPVVGASVALPLVLLVAPWTAGLPVLLGLAILGVLVVTVLGLVMFGLGLDDDDRALLTRLGSRFRR
jgi:O-antigen/teichoic acid export membrane protein